MDQIIFEDKSEQFGFTPIPNAVLTSTVLSPVEVRIYAILRRYASLPQGAMPSAPSICAEANISKATYNRAIKKFIKSDTNPNPEVPLITAIHRKGKSSIFKIHKINDYLIEKLKPVVSLSQIEKKIIKSQKRQSKKRLSQNETTYPSQNETTYPSQNETTYPSQNETRIIKNNNNIDNNKQERNDDVVVEIKKKIKANFNQRISTKAAEMLHELLLKNDKKIDDIIGQTKSYFESREESPRNLVGALRYAIEHGWDVDIKEQEDQQKKEEKKKYYDELRRKALIAAGIDPDVIGSDAQ